MLKRLFSLKNEKNEVRQSVSDPSIPRSFVPTFRRIVTRFALVRPHSHPLSPVSMHPSASEPLFIGLLGSWDLCKWRIYGSFGSSRAHKREIPRCRLCGHPRISAAGGYAAGIADAGNPRRHTDITCVVLPGVQVPLSLVRRVCTASR